MTERAKTILVLAVATVLSAATARSGEQAQFKGSTSVELPKPTRTIENTRRLNGEPERPNLDGGFVGAPPIDSSPLSNRKMREEMDKKKNWIFMNPYEDHFDSKTEEFMKGEKGTGLYDNHWMTSSQEKTAVQKFLDEKKDKRPTKDGDRQKTEKDDVSDRDRANDRDNPLNSRDDADLKQESGSFGTKAPFETVIFKQGFSSDPFASDQLDKKLERDSLGASPFAAQKSSLSAVERAEFQQKEIAHEREFNDILQTRPGGAISGGRVDVLNPAADIGRLDLNTSPATTSRRPDQFSTFNSGGPSRATFTDGGSSIGSGIRPDIGSGTEAFGFGIKAPTAAFAPSLPQASTAPSAGTVQAPFSFSLPQRKF